MPRLLVLVNGLPGSGTTTLAQRLGPALQAVVISKDAIKEAVADAIGITGAASRTLGASSMEMAWSLASAVEGVAVVDSWWFAPRDTAFARDGINRVAADKTVEVWCDATVEVARARVAHRRRHRVHRDSERVDSAWAEWAADARPLDLCATVHVDTSDPVDLSDVLAHISRDEAPG